MTHQMLETLRVDLQTCNRTIYLLLIVSVLNRCKKTICANLLHLIIILNKILTQYLYKSQIITVKR